MATPQPDFALLSVNKPTGPTSHDVVAAIRRGTGQRRVGHAGTLDPMAEGVLVIALGKATRLLEYVASTDKRYRATVRLGLTTDTYDLQGEIVDRRTVAPDLSAETIHELLVQEFTGEILQQPPVYSALKIGGVAAYARARAGEDVDLDPRPVIIHSVQLLSFEPPDVMLDVHCGPGTYIRSLAHDLGQALGSGGTLAALTRTASGSFHVDEAVPLDALLAAFDDGTWKSFLLPAALALEDTPEIHLSAVDFEGVRNGVAIPASEAAGLACAYAPDGRFVAVLIGKDGAWRPKKVFA